MKYTKIAASVMLVAGLAPNATFAANISDAEATALIERLKKLEQEVVTLRSKLNNSESENTQKSDAQVPAKKTESASNVTSVNWKGAPEVKGKDGWSVKPRGRMLYDFANLSSVPDTIDIPGEGFSNEARRVRIGIQGTMPGGFGYKLETDLPGGTSLTDAYISYKNDNWKFTFGQHNNFQSFEELTSSNDSSFIERAAFTDAFGFQRKLGISAATKVGSLNVQAGIFTDNLDDLDDGNESISLDTRVFASPKVDGMQMHFGGSLHMRDLGDSIDTVRYRARPMVHSVDTRFINTDRIAGAQKENSYGLEAGVIAGRFHAMAEVHTVKVDRDGFDDPSFFGGAIEAGYFLTNDTRQYKGGVFKGVKVSEPVSAGGIGAWQVNLRFDRLDLEDGDIVGGTQDAYMASLIWTPINNVRFLLQYGHLSYSNAMDIVEGAPNDFSVNVLGARTQVSF
ncbi:OprO/OprP family phosphate-selective porin [Aliiglaciecola sp. M165]|uniref:OprO/OprP family phosphate-selective porin n=1 Tax=Aliiglaciecola sp. M165 TaxID=2593649 RepID=UPI00117DC72F|nr:porin [Aliiglaciecola sp. M165]TRY33927.1 porin [Aliiglaciecola sp. M165]